MTDSSDSDDITLPAKPRTRLTSILHFQILDHIGAGGMGEVFLARDTKLDRLVALKTMFPAIASVSSYRRRFVTEARAAARLAHPNICRIYSIEEEGAKIFITMEFVQGKTLRQFVQERQIDMGHLYEIAIQCCRGLQNAHEAQISHRDIKSSNIMIDRKDCIKIMDFGLATIGYRTPTKGSQRVLGTLAYMAPELLLGQQGDSRCDLYSLGVVLYEIASGRRPFRGDSTEELTSNILHGQAEPLGELRPDVSERFQQVVNKAMARDSSERYQKIEHMLTDLKSIQLEKSVFHLASSVRNSIAVFPFRNLSDDPDLEYLSEGISDDIIGRLVRIKSLSVASTAAVSKVKGETGDRISVAKELNVSSILEGSIQKQGDKIRISVQMVRVTDEIVVWSDSFYRKMTDLFELQIEVAESVARALHPDVPTDELKPRFGKPSASIDVYDLYLRGKFHLKRRDRESLLKAIELLTDASTRDLEYSPALAELATAHVLFQSYGFGDSGKKPQEVFELACRSVELEPSLSEAHMAVALVLRTSNLSRNSTELQTAIALDPSNFEAHHFMAHTSITRGHYQSALKEEQMALQLNPYQELSRPLLCRIYFYLDRKEEVEDQIQLMARDEDSESSVLQTCGWLCWSRRDWTGAVDNLKKLIELLPENYYALDYLSDCYRRLGMYGEAESLLDTGLERVSNPYILHARYAQLYVDTGRQDQADKEVVLAHGALDKTARDWLDPDSAIFNYNKALLFARENNADDCLIHIQKAVDKGFGHYADLLTRPDWDSVRDSKSFKELATTLQSSGESDDLRYH